MLVFVLHFLFSGCLRQCVTSPPPRLNSDHPKRGVTSGRSHSPEVLTQGTAMAEPPAVGTQLDITDFECPICRDLLYKPVVNGTHISVSPQNRCSALLLQSCILLPEFQPGTIILVVPAVCGHVHCFWCAHQAMSPFTASKCSLCRHAFGHFPRICVLLHRVVRKAFPAQFAQRAEETLGEGRHADGAASAAVSTVSTDRSMRPFAQTRNSLEAPTPPW